MNPVTPPEGWGFSQGNNLNLPFLPGLKAGASWGNGVKMTDKNLPTRSKM
jgi:hypothetical protein